jgi:hypothetical protein
MCPIKGKKTGIIGHYLWHFLAWTIGLLLLIPIFILLFYFLAKETSRATLAPSPNGVPFRISGDSKSFPSEKSLFLTSNLERNAEREGWS